MNFKELLELISKGENEKVEFKTTINRKTMESVCAFANTYGGKIVVGISDNSKIIGIENAKDQLQKFSDMLNSSVPSIKVETEIFNIDNDNLIVISVKKSNLLHSYKNIVYVRTGKNNKPINPMELLSMAGEGMMISFDSIETKISTDNANESLIDQFYLYREEVRGIKKPIISKEDKLIQLGVAYKNKNHSFLNSAGVLFFTDYPQKIFNSAYVEILEFEDTSMNNLISREKIDGPMINMVEQIFDLLQQKNPSQEFLEPNKIRRKRTSLYPLPALREAVLNAIIHRNYYDPGYVQIFIQPDRITIQNPGAFPYGVSPEHPIHKPRNPLISNLMYETGFVEKYGSGIKKIKKEMEKSKTSDFKYNEYILYTEISFYKKIKINLDSIDKKIISLLLNERKSSEIAKELKLSIPAVVSRLNKLISSNLVKKIGSGKNTKYKKANGELWMGWKLWETIDKQLRSYWKAVGKKLDMGYKI